MIERVARVLAGEHFSANAEGDAGSAVRSVEERWPDFQGQAIAILKTMREPDEAMAKSGDFEVWRSMIAAALGDEPSGAFQPGVQDQLGIGNDAFIEGP